MATGTAQDLEWRPVAAFVRMGWRRSSSDRASAIGLVLLYWLVLLIFWGLWQATPLAELIETGMTRPAVFRYLVITECIAMAAGYPYRTIEHDIQSGEIAAGMLRPIPYSIAMLADWLGQTCHRLLLLSIAGAAAAIWLTGSVPFAFSVLPLLVLSMLLGCALVLLCQLQIGYATTWMGTAAPVFWIWQKALFVMGGLMIPLTLYPTGLRSVAELLPFAGMLYWPGSIALAQSWTELVWPLGLQMFWLCVLGGLTWCVDDAAARRIALRGI
ncbi:MAG TPA: ABC-2 family transporter protein [Steroidobacteraceae bacterium]|nr:ABC-2 family transporter protein [Steroidobacteraceae bacterium]